MSLRGKPATRSAASESRLDHVLSIGCGVLPGPRPVSGGYAVHTPITIEGVVVSTDPSHWTPLTVGDMVKLELNPIDMAEFNRKGRANSHPNAAYLNTAFASPFVPRGEVVFWVEHLGYVPPGEFAYYVLATRGSDAVPHSRA